MHFQNLAVSTALALGFAAGTTAFAQAPAQNPYQGQPGQAQRPQGQQGQGQQIQGQPLQGQAQPQGRPVGQVPAAVEPQRPFPPAAAAAEQRLNQLLMKWEAESKNTKLMECQFTRWHYDANEAPAGIAGNWAMGTIRYAAPDKGEFVVNAIQFFTGLDENQKPKFAPDAKREGEHWVCNGSEILNFDRSEKKCTIQVLPQEMRGQKIFDSPLPFVFNLDAAKLQERYWVREVAPPANKKDTYLIEAWPKSQEDRSQYLFVQISIDAATFLPHALVLYAPNFDPQNAPTYDHYEFSKVTRNGFINNIQSFTDSFIKVKPDKSWTVIREPFMGDAQAALPASGPQQR